MTNEGRILKTTTITKEGEEIVVFTRRTADRVLVDDLIIAEKNYLKGRKDEREKCEKVYNAKVKLNVGIAGNIRFQDGLEKGYQKARTELIAEIDIKKEDIRTGAECEHPFCKDYASCQVDTYIHFKLEKLKGGEKAGMSTRPGRAVSPNREGGRK